MHFSQEKNIFVALHHGSEFILINKSTTLLRKYFKIYLYTILQANDLTILHLSRSLTLFLTPFYSVNVYLL